MTHTSTIRESQISKHTNLPRRMPYGASAELEDPPNFDAYECANGAKDPHIATLLHDAGGCL